MLKSKPGLQPEPLRVTDAVVAAVQFKETLLGGQGSNQAETTKK
jgi:hypothetical protein